MTAVFAVSSSATCQIRRELLATRQTVHNPRYIRAALGQGGSRAVTGQRQFTRWPQAAKLGNYSCDYILYFLLCKSDWTELSWKPSSPPFWKWKPQNTGWLQKNLLESIHSWFLQMTFGPFTHLETCLCVRPAFKPHMRSVPARAKCRI